MPIRVPVEQTGLERSIQKAAQKAGRNLKVDLGTNAKSIKSLEQPLGRITGKADEFTKSLEASNARVIAFGASVGIINGVVQSFKSLVSTTIEVEKSLSKINSILNTNTAGLNNLKSQIFEIAKNTEQTFDTVAEAALELSRQGLSATEVTKRLNDSLILSRLAGIDASEAVAGLTAAVNSFSKAGLTTGDVLNKISAAANKFAVSERDLIEGFKRSASVAEQAGVSIDELGGIITAVQQRTARGGAVIGNSFKTIFTRIGRAENLQLLSDLGVQITDVEGKILPATKLIENLAQKLEELDQVQVRSITEKIGGGFQIAPLLAALSDYSSETSIAIQATEAFANATNEAYRKNEIQNQTLSTAINRTTLSIKELANALGEIGVLDVFKELLNSLNSFTERITNFLQGDSIGSKFAKSILGGLGETLIKGGIILFGAIIGKLAFDLAKFGVSSLKTFLGLGKEAERIKNVQQQIVSTLLSDKSVRESILNIENQSISAEQKRLQQAEFFNTALRERVKLTSQLSGIAGGIAPRIRSGGGSVGRSAGGFLPIGAEQSDISKGVGGAPSSAKPVVIPNFAFGGGKRGTMVANSSEYIVPNFAGGGSAIFNQDMVKSMGLPSGAKKINAAGGFIPNFAPLKFQGFRGSDGKIYKNKNAANAGVERGDITQEELNEKAYGSQLATKKKVESSRLGFFANSQRGQGGFVLLLPQSQKAFDPDGADTRFDKKRTYKGKSLSFFEGGSAGIYPNLKDDDSAQGKKYSSLISLDSTMDKALSGAVSTLVKNAVKGFGGDPASSELEPNKIIDQLDKGGAGAFGAIKGAVFENVMNNLLGSLDDKGSELDVDIGKSADSRKSLEYIFQLPPGQFNYGDFKSSIAQKLKYTKQVLDSGYEGAVGTPDEFTRKKIVGNTRVFQPAAKTSKSAASGYIPNYAMSPLEDAIQREKEAGVPVNQIRINQDGKLRNSQNPDGLAVTNTRDEPTGRIPQNAAGGYVPNFVLPQGVTNLNQLPGSGSASGSRVDDLGDASKDVTGKLLGLSLVTSLLGNTLSGVDENANAVIKGFAGVTEGVLSAVTTLSLISTLDIKKFTGQDPITFGGIGSATGLSKGLDKITKTIGPLGKGLLFLGKQGLRLVPVLGQLFAGFQIINSITKSFGLDLGKAAGELFGFIDTPAEKAAKSLEKLSDAALKNAITTGEFSTKPFEDFLNRVGSLSEKELEENLSGRGKKALKEGSDTDVLTESVKDSLRSFGAGDIIGDLILKETTANISKVIGVNKFGVPETRKEEVSALDLPETAQDLILRNLAESKQAGSGITKILPSATDVNFQTSLGKIEALFDAQFAAIQAYADPKQFAEITSAERRGDKEEVKKLTGELLEGEDLDRYRKLIEDIAKIPKIDSAEGQKALADRIEQEKNFKKNQKEEIESQKLSKKIELEIADIRRKSITQQSIQLTNLKSEVQLAQELVLLKKSSTAAEKLNAQFQLDAINSQKKLVQERAKAGVSRIEGARKSLGLTQEPGGEIKIEKERTFNALVQEVNRQLVERGKIDSKNLIAIAKEGKLSKSQIDNLKTIIKITNEEAEALSKQEKLQLAINNLTKAQAALNKINAQQDERRIKNLEKQLEFNEKNLDIEQQIADARAELRKAEIDAGVVGGNQFAKFSATQQKAAIDEQSLVRNYFTELNKSVGATARDILNKAINAGVSPDEGLFKQVEEFQKKGLAGGDLEGFINKLEKQSKKALQREKDAAIDKSIAEINNILTFGDIVDKFGTYVESLPGVGVRGGMDELDEVFGPGNRRRVFKFKNLGPNEQQSSTEGADSERGRLKAARSFLSSQRGKAPEGNILTDPKLILGNLQKQFDLAGIKLSANFLELANSVKEAGGSLTTFANLVRNELSGVRERIAQAQFNLTTTADPSQVQSSLVTLERERVLKETGDIGGANKAGLIFEKRFEIETATDNATKERLKFELDKTLQLLDIREKILKTTAGSPERQSLINEFTKKTKEQQSLASQFRGRLSKTAETIEQEFNEAFLNASTTFTDAITDGLTQAIAKGEDLGDVLLKAASAFIDTILQATLQKNIDSIVSSLTDSFVPSGSGDSGGGFIKKLLGFNSGGMVSGGSGVRDDVPAVLTSGEFVMKRDAVMKYGPNFMDTINNGNYQPDKMRVLEGRITKDNQGQPEEGGEEGPFGVRKFFIGGLVDAANWDYLPKGNYIKKEISDAEQAYYQANYQDQTGEGGFLGPGQRGAGGISGKENLLAFARQSYTSGATDIIEGGGRSGSGAASIDLEVESAKLTAFSRSQLASPLQQATDAAKLEAFDLRADQLANEEEYRQLKKIYKEALKDKIKGIWIQAASQIASAAVSKWAQTGAESVEAASAAKAAAAGQVAPSQTPTDTTTTGGIQAQNVKLTTGEKVVAFTRGFFKGNTYGDPSGQTYGGVFNSFNSRGFITSSNLQGYLDGFPGGQQSSFKYNTTGGIRSASERPTLTTSSTGPSTGPNLSQAYTTTNADRASTYGLSQKSYNALVDRFNEYNPQFAAAGGYIQDTAGIDTVPAMLNGGEFVMNSAATERLGTSNLEKLNSGSEINSEEDSKMADRIVDKLDELIEETKKSTGDVSITVNGSSETEESSGNEDNEERRNRDKRFADRLKKEVLKIIEDQKRVGGTLRDM